MTKGAYLAALSMGAALLTSPLLAGDELVQLSATLDGGGETAGGDSGGTGEFFAEIDAVSGDLCYTLVVSDIANATAAHIHLGAAGADGDPVVTINVTGEDGDECVAMSRDILKAIVAKPRGYYVNVHNAEFPAGAIRGQLGKAED